MIQEILKIAKDNPFGFTFDLVKKQMVQFGYSAAFKETQNCFGIEGLEKVLEHALNHDKKIGGWLNSENEYYYFDSIKIFTSKVEALKFANENEQIAIFDLTNLIEIKV